ncbi:L-histidine N(alpha)-methyltransferase [Hydrogenophaga sp. 5NK40-0174]|uniref:L-histidine N(alpha)-methyltransferase n=1 Tax=Hydrogenophaga sp. 5NK40-0174 TaxID=3127649 RepID=UPI00310ADA29
MTAATPHFVQVYEEDRAAVRAELAAGLLANPARVAPKFFYDVLGSRLFDAITELDEYYPTRTEAAIFAAHGEAMAQAVPAGAVMIELGAGNSAKAASLFGQLRPAAYVAVDISVVYMRESLTALQEQHPALPMLGLGMDFSSSLALPDAVQAWLDEQGLAGAPRVVFYPGSSIGNFSPTEAEALLRQAHAVCGGGGPGSGLLIGVDLVKDVTVLERAYDDALGVTAAFNRNALRHVNELLGANFAPERWAHVAFFNAGASRIEMHLASVGEQVVKWGDGGGAVRRFADGERIHTENSYKWTEEGFSALLAEAGFVASSVSASASASQGCWMDVEEWFGVFWRKA